MTVEIRTASTEDPKTFDVLVDGARIGDVELLLWPARDPEPKWYGSLGGIFQPEPFETKAEAAYNLHAIAERKAR